MKTAGTFAFFLFIAAFSWASDWETYEIVNRLLTIREPSSPIIYENTVIFTSDSSLRRVGVAFAHEGFSTVHWFQRLLVPQDRIDPVFLPGQKIPDPLKDSGLQFYIYKLPETIKELEYRLIINGLWTIDTSNPQVRRDPLSGLSLSILTLPQRPVNLNPVNGLPEGLKFTFEGPPGEIVTVGGSFNGWDPFMYELKENPPGVYTFMLPLPSGTYQYVFFHRGQRFTDPHNPKRIYARDGSSASEIIIP